MVRLFASLIQRIGGVCQVEPSHFPLARPDLLVFLPDCSFLVDLVLPPIRSFLSPFGDRAKSFLTTLSALARDSISSSLPSSPLAASLAILLQKCNAYILSRGVVTSASAVYRR